MNRFNLYLKKALLFILLALATLVKAQQWVELQTGVTENLYDVCCVDDNTVFVCGQNGVILKTEDGGNTWQEKYRNEGNNLYDLCFVDDAIGFAYGDFFVKTTDGGENWVLIDTKYQEGEKLSIKKDDDVYYNSARVFAVDADTLYFVSFFGWLSKSIDGGETASFVLQDYTYYIPKPENSWRLYFEDNVGFVVYISEKVTIYKSIDYGKSWNMVLEIEDTPFLYSTMVHFINKDTIKLFSEPVPEYYLQWDNVIMTNDGFVTTSLEKSYIDYWLTTYFRDFKFSSPENGCFLARNGLYDGSCFAAITNDGGTHWRYCSDGFINEYDANGVDGIDTAYFVAADHGRVYRMKKGIEDVTVLSEKSITIYPNPTNSTIIIQGERIATVELYSGLGICIDKKEIEVDNESCNFDVRGLAVGIYYLRIKDKKGSLIVKRFIKRSGLQN